MKLSVSVSTFDIKDFFFQQDDDIKLQNKIDMKLQKRAHTQKKTQ